MFNEPVSDNYEKNFGIRGFPTIYSDPSLLSWIGCHLRISEFWGILKKWKMTAELLLFFYFFKKGGTYEEKFDIYFLFVI